MVLALENLQSRVDFAFHVIDIDAQTQWEPEFGDKVPVLLYEDRELCHYFLDEPVVTAFLSQLR
jgi:thioredoxin reductase (NADPH)